MKKLSFVGIDPGKNGGVAVFWCDGESDSYRFPKLEYQLPQIIKKIKSMAREKKTKLDWVIEDIHALYGSSAKATFSFGKNLGHWEGVLYSSNVKWETVSPKVWQSEYKLSKDKKRRKNKLKKIAQSIVDYKVTLATADAILIAKWRKDNYER